MKLNLPSLSGRPRLSKSNKGIALILVLGFLVLITGLVVAFFSSVTTELTTATSYASGAGTKQLADSAVGTVMAQIKIATSGSNSGTNTAWASQPGMIRTYDDTGKRVACYKLYSSSNMVVAPTGTFNPGADVPSTGWDKQTAFYTDLNAPVITTTGTNYPIVDASAIGNVDGFSVTGAPVGSGTSANPLPMPVRWLYMLKDGTLTVPDDPTATTTTTATFTTKTIPTASNPIVGRIAFWTDDESCKLNLNTASEPTPWDTPRAVTIQDLNYGKFQPAQKEFQRFPGHPFMNALSPVFFPKLNPSLSGTVTLAQKQAIYSLVPRVAAGGSQAATISVASAATVAPDSDRLFANADEALFSYPLNSGPARPPNTLIPPEALRRARFFLTANSRAPEVNLFGQPRVSLWPINTDANFRTGYDKLAAFCSTTGTGSNAKPYYFQRTDSTSPKKDYDTITRNRDLYKYLQNLTGRAIPGYGGDFLSKWSDDRDQVLTEIFDYIRCVNLRDPLLVQQNLTRYADNGQVAPIQIDANTTQGFGRFQGISQFGLHFICVKSGTTGAAEAKNVALKDGERLIQAAFLFEPFSPSLGYYELHGATCYEVTFDKGSRMMVENTDLGLPTTTVTVNSGSGFGGIWHGRDWGGAQGIRGPIARFGGASYPLVGTFVKVGGLVNGQPVSLMSFSGGAVEVKVYSGTTPDSSKLIQTYNVRFPTNNFPIPELVPPTLPPGKHSTEAFRGNPGSATDPIAWWTLQSRYGMAADVPHAPGDEYPDKNRRWGNDRSGNPPGFKRGGVFRKEDVVRAVVPVNGDIRLIAARKTVDSSFFDRGRSYGDVTVKFDHLFSEPQGPHMLYGFANEPTGTGTPPAPGLASVAPDDQLVPSSAVTYHYARLPEITPGAGKKYNKWNDFDNGFAHMTDGAYINKPDEGNVADQNSQYAYFSWDFTAPKEMFFSPSRLVPSAGMLGSLPTGVKRNQPWQTLLFRPEVRKDHPGLGTPLSGPPYTKPPDHLIMDLFWMPVIEPYAISEPFSTSGKVNMNYQIAPFTYIKRATAMYGALKAEEPLVIPNAASKIYKLWDHETNDWPFYPNNSANSQDLDVRSKWDALFKGQSPYDKMRRPIDPGLTLAQADDRFAGTGDFASKGPDIFRSASEICELHLVREGESLADYKGGKIYDDALMTGDNTRERPYTNLYAKLTTRSNVYTVHYRVQKLKKSSVTAAAQWDEVKDQVVGEYRGSTMIERYIDASDPTLPDFTTAAGNLDSYYKFRVVSTKKFAP